jgi:hypothetical protein
VRGPSGTVRRFNCTVLIFREDESMFCPPTCLPGLRCLRRNGEVRAMHKMFGPWCRAEGIECYQIMWPLQRPTSNFPVFPTKRLQIREDRPPRMPPPTLSPSRLRRSGTISAVGRVMCAFDDDAITMVGTTACIVRTATTIVPNGGDDGSVVVAGFGNEHPS